MANHLPALMSVDTFSRKPVMLEGNSTPTVVLGDFQFSSKKDSEFFRKIFPLCINYAPYSYIRSVVKYGGLADGANVRRGGYRRNDGMSLCGCAQ